MSFILKFKHRESSICFISNEQTEEIAILRAFNELFYSLAEDNGRAEKALEEVREMSLEDQKKYKFNTDVYHYRSVLTLSSIKEITAEQYTVLSELSNDLDLYM